MPFPALAATSAEPNGIGDNDGWWVKPTSALPRNPHCRLHPNGIGAASSVGRAKVEPLRLPPPLLGNV